MFLFTVKLVQLVLGTPVGFFSIALPQCLVMETSSSCAFLAAARLHSPPGICWGALGKDTEPTVIRSSSLKAPSSVVTVPTRMRHKSTSDLLHVNRSLSNDQSGKHTNPELLE